MTSRDIDQAVAQLASRQHQLFARWQAEDLGASRRMIDRRAASGHWPVEVAGVHGVAGATHSWHRRLMTAHLDLGPRSVVSHRAGSALLGLPNARRGSPELTVPRGAGRSTRWRVHEGTVPSRDRTRVDGIPVTTVTRTVLDMAALLPARVLQGLVEDLLIGGRLKLDPFAARVAENRRPGRRGSATLATVLDGLATGSLPPESELEARLFAVLAAAGLPAPVRQMPLPSISGLGRVDAAYPAARLIIEVDGRKWHARYQTMERDKLRDIEAGLLGWRVLRFSWWDIVERPEWVCWVIASHLQMAA